MDGRPSRSTAAATVQVMQARTLGASSWPAFCARFGTSRTEKEMHSQPPCICSPKDDAVGTGVATSRPAVEMRRRGRMLYVVLVLVAVLFSLFRQSIIVAPSLPSDGCITLGSSHTGSSVFALLAGMSQFAHGSQIFHERRARAVILSDEREMAKRRVFTTVAKSGRDFHRRVRRKSLVLSNDCNASDTLLDPRHSFWRPLVRSRWSPSIRSSPEAFVTHHIPAIALTFISIWHTNSHTTTPTVIPKLNITTVAV